MMILERRRVLEDFLHDVAHWIMRSPGKDNLLSLFNMVSTKVPAIGRKSPNNNRQLMVHCQVKGIQPTCFRYGRARYRFEKPREIGFLP